MAFKFQFSSINCIKTCWHLKRQKAVFVLLMLAFKMPTEAFKMLKKKHLNFMKWTTGVTGQSFTSAFKCGGNGP